MSKKKKQKSKPYWPYIVKYNSPLLRPRPPWNLVLYREFRPEVLEYLQEHAGSRHKVVPQTLESNHQGEAGERWAYIIYFQDHDDMLMFKLACDGFV